MKNVKFLICAVAAVASATAQGQNIPATLNTIIPGLATTGTYGADIHTLPAGVLDFTDFNAFCVEPLEALGFNESVIYQVQTPGSLANYDAIARLVNGYLASPQTDLDSAAMQWAIWEITSETSGSYSLLGGNVQLSVPDSENVAIRANQFLANLNSYSPATITYLSSATHQDIVSWNVVPEPTSVGLVALSGALLLRRRRR